MSLQTVLVIDDERDIRELLTITLGRMDLQVEAVGTVADARRALSENSYDLCFTDMRLPDGNGQEIIELIAETCPDTPVAMITAYGNVDAAVNALKAGAFDFVSKPVDIQMLRGLVRTALRLAEEKREGGGAAKAGGSGDRLIGDSPAMEQVRATIAKLARNQAPVYIAGESGVGKELVARLIHERGPRAGGPFVPVNCGAIPSELMESEFFGHRKGSFTGASADKEGLFQAAQGGTLFLDEVAELPLHMQVKLLRAIQEKAVRPIGGRDEIPVDVRILSATHKNLGQLVEQGQFRQDLFYRINVIELRVPPLRERRGDVPQLAAFILKSLAGKSGQEVGRLTPAALDALEAYDFPGNVRELENILERAMAMSDGASIEASDLMLPQRGARPAPTEVAATAGAPAAAAAAAPSADGGLDDYISNIERTAIVKALEESRYNKTAAARKLGITFRALRYKLKKLGID
ncbi:MAG: sigma-54-dependent Fis family transcriptional regulator [Rhodanobacter sp.]|jgi:two-component system response regulator PilR (NtrC family)|uniref:Sigma-54-dependent transcriptional regulator n=2 Tax=unclassified Rhodanobacter TaxID=2621553 RepID=A0AB74UML0_9GAMM|nr:sigma-54-dependent Fis family transcriptional regulator [Rhodanobacter sp.]MBN8947140.1 sigma-54-dependent Fis family transcriptional regulator [Rhodanobacter sp.]ODT95777.1 MAG: sigma-54-dependent Fis family transcriptional regulator [Rhodanobacter sp. SCN 67-45]OJW41854.1 MAG: sigma-54-dependent Fis family transcriptional regulator [Rhodanobacter sp. 67-28]